MKKLPNKDFYNFEIYSYFVDSGWMKTPIQQQTTVVVVQEANASNLALLEKILGAVKQNLKEDCLVIQQKEAVAFKHILQMVSVERLLVFGWTPIDLGLHLSIRPYQPVTFAGIQLLFSPNLAVIAANKNKEKQQLWTQLQILF